MRSLQHSSAVGAGFIPVLPTADKIQSKCPAAARVGINPTPKVVECCKRLIINSLNRMSVWLYPHPNATCVIFSANAKPVGAVSGRENNTSPDESNPHCSYISATPLISRTRFFLISAFWVHTNFLAFIGIWSTLSVSYICSKSSSGSLHFLTAIFSPLLRLAVLVATICLFIRLFHLNFYWHGIIVALVASDRCSLHAMV